MADEKIKHMKPGYGCLTCPLPSCSRSCRNTAATREEYEMLKAAGRRYGKSARKLSYPGKASESARRAYGKGEASTSTGGQAGPEYFVAMLSKEDQMDGMKVYEDGRGWQFKVMGGLGKNTFKARYKKISRDGWHCVAILPWRTTAEEAQADLDSYAAKKGMKEVRS